MPSLQDIEQFKSDLNAIGNEEEILAEQGLTIEDIEPPESGLSDDLSELLDLDTSAAETPSEEAAEAETAEAPEETEAPDEAEAFEMPEEPQAPEETEAPDEAEAFEMPEEPPPEQPAETDFEDLGDMEIPDEDFPFDEAEDAEAGDFDIDSIFAGLEEPAGEEAEEEPPPETAAPEEPAEEEPPPEEPEDEFGGISEEEYAGLTESMDTPSVDEEESDDFSDVDFELPDDIADAGTPDIFAGGDEEDAGIAGEGEEEAEELPEEFELPEGFADEDFGFEEEPVAGAEEAGEAAGIVEPGEDVGAVEPGAWEAEEEAEEVPAEAPGEVPGEIPEEFELPEGFADEDFSLEEEEPGVGAVAEEGAAEGADLESDLGEELELGEPGEEAGGDIEESVPEEFAFDDGVDEFELPPETADEGAGIGEEVDEESEIGEEDFDLDDFSLGDLSEQFGVTEDESELPTEEELNPALAVSEQLPGSQDVLDLSDDQFESLKRTLSTLPRNLRIIVEEAIGEEQLSGENLETLVDALVRGRSPKEIANIAGRITGQRIVIPSAYEKRTGIEFEEEKGTFAYLFKYKILPFARTAAVVLVILGVLSFVGYRFVYRPVRAAILYNRGLENIENGSYIAGNETFDEARELWESRRRFFQYADEFAEQNRNDLAADKYEELLAASGGFDRQGLLDYANLETYRRANYSHAEQLLNKILNRDEYIYDYDALLQSGDNYMEWALENPDKYEDARLAFATLIQNYGQRDELMFRMLEYFIRTDNLQEVVALKKYFQSIDTIELNTPIYAELGGYLISRDIATGRSEYVSDAREVLFRAMEQDPDLPDVHYHLSRLFRHLGNYGEEKTALTKAFQAYRAQRNRNPLEETRFIDTMNRQGEAAFRDRQYLEAEDKFLAAKKTFEAAENRDFLSENETFGRIYSNLADVYYYVSGNFPSAMNNYQTAREMGYSPPVLHYKMGYINYRNGRYGDALMKFYEASGDFSSNENLMFATANTLYHQRLYSAAQGYYLHLITDLENERRNIPDLRPEERPEHRALLENLMRAYTNLGATLYRLSEQTGDSEKVTEALVHLTTASEFFDRLTRDRQTLVRTESKNLSFLNTRAIIYPEPGFEVEIYNEIPRDLTEMAF